MRSSGTTIASRVTDWENLLYFMDWPQSDYAKLEAKGTEDAAY